LDYDSLIVATGSQTSYFAHDEWHEWAPGLKSIEEATTIRHKILYAFEVAERILDPEQRRAWLTFVIVGAGPTGVELAGAIAEIAKPAAANAEKRLPFHPPGRGDNPAVGWGASGADAFSGGSGGESNAFTWQAGR